MKNRNRIQQLSPKKFGLETPTGKKVLGVLEEIGWSDETRSFFAVVEGKRPTSEEHGDHSACRMSFDNEIDALFVAILLQKGLNEQEALFLLNLTRAYAKDKNENINIASR